MDRLIGVKPDRFLFAEVAQTAAAELDCESDIHASADYRKQVAKVLARRVLEEAAERAIIAATHRSPTPFPRPGKDEGTA
jgi:CO/xanthine dehydrogenase FAD-binding subunit